MNTSSVTPNGWTLALLGLVRYRVIVILVATLVIAATFVPGFLEIRTLSLGLDRAATMGLIAIGLTVVLIAGQLDLSGGAILALSSIAAVGLQGELGQVPAALVGLGVGLAAGCFNGLLVVVFRINSLVATLASMLLFRAICHLITDSRPVSGIDPFFGIPLTQPLVWTLSARVTVFLVLILLLHLWLTRFVAGRNLFAVGSNATSAAASGIRSRWYLFGAFVFSGLMAGVAGVTLGVASNTGSPVFGDTIVLTAIAAVVIGGTRLEGGIGSALGTLGGILTLASLTTAMEYQSVPAYVQDIVTGITLLLLILLDRLTHSKRGVDVSLTTLARRFSPTKTGSQPKETERTIA
ncbi:monosaccharide ABC transporter membrane protein (CUT2 family) [Leucobacter luti]|uniref:Monosaccharide ABC transporter membrane protein (CUT2 family) n=1 Tax=Leucobacter luti TaxID=340320 RepID=A0A4R6S3W0_9MICO|nr:ABC transporter permease [Leucobacter luti]TDP93385.1 monosaccharide ABC transporter membrane protein (CUT2 family) [Leucobacter luti]